MFMVIIIDISITVISTTIDYSYHYATQTPPAKSGPRSGLYE